ncbi:MAG: leucyl/phenylalanyl-tRNA--protein transferase [Candidatus Schekmanbacteria bacterium]|nr:leucyl/phenylalanyl-tRNA--protein transferase [Candidatus Schekmanbacteria bacterium]
MPVFRLSSELAFPRPELADASGLLAVGGDLSPARLLFAYRIGVFPWYDANQPILWWSPNPRHVLLPQEYHLPRSLRKELHRRRFELRVDQAFEAVMRGCARAFRPGQDGTWITEDMIEAYVRLHVLGYAHSIESWSAGELCGGLYGISLGSCFFGESMFAARPDASKVAFAGLVLQLWRWGFSLIDCQTRTAHLARFGGRDVARRRFMALLAKGLLAPTRLGRWKLDEDLQDELAAWRGFARGSAK